ncbi:MAG: gamma-glutamyltransferase [Pseudomonadota bacterium]
MTDPFAQFSTTQQITKPMVEAPGGVVVAQNRTAAAVGARVLAKGGNAVDAAVATAFALAVVEPWMSGLGGGGAMILHRPGEAAPEIVDFPVRAPMALDPADYPLSGEADDDLFGWPGVVEGRNLIGATAVAVPGAVAGYAMALDRFGTLDWADAVRPAIALAHEGLLCDWFTILQIASVARDLARFPASRMAFLPGGQPPPHPAPAMRLPREGLARTLEVLAERGPDAFYRGALGESLVEDVRAAGGSLCLEDLGRYQAQIRQPLSAPLGGATAYGLPALSGGPTMAHALRALDGGGTPSATAMARALLAAFDDRLTGMGDEDGRRGEACTTHVSVVDRQGTLVALTTTLLSAFGSRMVAPGTGILLNNGINWFDPRPGRPNSLGAGKWPLCNYGPAVALWPDGRGVALGASGGRRIIGAVTQLLASVGLVGLSIEEALHAPRVDVSGGGTIAANPALGDEIIAELRQLAEVTVAAPSPMPNLYAMPSMVERDGTSRRGGAEPCHPWADAVGTA